MVKLKLTTCFLVLTVCLLSSCTKDVLIGQPEWLGNSIYERLQEGIEVDGQKKSFQTTLRLIDDLGQTEVLAHTGSKTLFVADDDAFSKWFAENNTSYEQLTTAQKKMLFNHSMINNAYLLELMSNVSGNPPQTGMCMRRPTAASIQDTVFTIKPNEMPVNPMNLEKLDTWKKFRDENKSVLVFKDNNSAPMIHFLPAYMTKNKITDEDLMVLSNHVSESINDSWIDGKKIISAEQTCKNGYIYVVDGVIESNSNMAEIIRNTPEMSEWSKMLDRFSTPVYDDTNTKEYRRLNQDKPGVEQDSVYVLRYFADEYNGKSSNRSNDKYNTLEDGSKVPATLTFDPGWNNYMYYNSLGQDMHYDAGAMIVPTNEALNNWWNNAGKGLQEEYGSWENVPALTLSKLLRVNMLLSFKDAVPSKFGTIVDDAKVTLGIQPEDVVKCYMGCNGVIYLVNKVFAPSEYRSVAYPALAHQSLMSVIYYAIDNYDFGPFLNSMESKFTLILPTNDALLRYIDPCTYGLQQQVMYEFYYDETDQCVKAHRYHCSYGSSGLVIEEQLKDASYSTDSKMSNEVMNRLSDLVDNMIIVGLVKDGQQYYKTKAGSVIKIDNSRSPMTISGGYQIERSEPVAVDQVYDMNENGNGYSYGVQTPIMTSQYSVYERLSQKKEYSEFLSLLNDDDTDDGLLATTTGSTSSLYYCANDGSNKNIRLFDNYNYTVYVPTNESIKEMIDKGYLPTWDDYKSYAEDAERGDSTAIKAQTIIAERIQNFLRYHIQDNSIFIGGDPVTGVKYESSKINPNNNRFYSFEVTADNNGLEVEDQLSNKRHVVKTDGLYNNMCREYWIKKTGTKANETRYLYSSSNAVVHQIDGVLLFDESQLTSWKDEIGK